MGFFPTFSGFSLFLFVSRLSPELISPSPFSPPFSSLPLSFFLRSFILILSSSLPSSLCAFPFVSGRSSAAARFLRPFRHSFGPFLCLFSFVRPLPLPSPLFFSLFPVGFRFSLPPSFSSLASCRILQLPYRRWSGRVFILRCRRGSSGRESPVRRARRQPSSAIARRRLQAAGAATLRPVAAPVPKACRSEWRPKPIR